MTNVGGNLKIFGSRLLIAIRVRGSFVNNRVYIENICDPIQEVICKYIGGILKQIGSRLVIAIQFRGASAKLSITISSPPPRLAGAPHHAWPGVAWVPLLPLARLAAALNCVEQRGLDFPVGI
jgi:hypothetical protein